MKRLPLCLLFASLMGVTGCATQRPSAPNSPTSAAQSQSSGALFSERAQQAGLHFRHDSGATGRFYFAENTAPGGAFFDFDNDGFLDIFLVQSGAVAPPKNYVRPHCALYRNNGDGTFADATANSGLDQDLGFAQGVAVADYDNDGRSDLFITAYGGNRLLHNEGDGKFRDVTKSQGLGNERGYASSAAWGDYDNDGKLDLYVCTYAKWSPATDKMCRNRDGQLDYCSPLLYDPAPHHLYRNTGRGFVDVSSQSGISKKTGRGLAVAFIDYNGDGKQDIFVANDLSPNLLWRNNGNGTFSDTAIETGVAYGDQGRSMAGMGIAVADYDRSGRDSLFVTNFSERPNMLFRNAGGLFEDATLQITPPNSHDKILSFGCEFFDYDADGWHDIIVNNGHVEMLPAQRSPGVEYKQPKQLFKNDGKGTLHWVTDAALLGALNTPTLGRGLAVGDYDNDGRLDVLACNQGEPPQLFRNEVATQNHWISLRLIGTRSNRDAVGARVKIKAGGAWQSASVRGGSSYLSSSDRRLYFGLGNNSQIDEISVTWPSGTRETLKTLPVDKFHTITEGTPTK